MLITGSHINDIYRDALDFLLHHPSVVKAAPRGMETLEALGVQFRLDCPRCSILGLAERRLNYQFMVAEALWMLSGFNRVDLIQPYNKNIVMAADPLSDHFQGAYGVMILDQLEYVIDVLQKDPSSRQALLTIWRPRPYPSADVPCTISMQFFNRNDELHMHTYMRSQDIWLGTPYDFFNFTLVQQLVAYRLGIGLGEYVHTMGSLHIYQRNFDDASSVNLLSRAKDVKFKLPRVESAPMARIAAAYADLTSVAPSLISATQVSFVDSWWTKWRALIPEQPWNDMLNVLGRRFLELNNPNDIGWEQLLEIGR